MNESEKETTPKARKELIQAMVDNYAYNAAEAMHAVLKAHLSCLLEGYQSGKMDRETLTNAFKVLTAITMRVETNYDFSIPHEQIDKIIDEGKIPDGECCGIHSMSSETNEKVTLH